MKSSIISFLRLESDRSLSIILCNSSCEAVVTAPTLAACSLLITISPSGVIKPSTVAAVSGYAFWKSFIVSNVVTLAPTFSATFSTWATSVSKDLLAATVNMS